MTSKLKWWLNGIGAVILVAVAAVYLIARPIIVQNLEPVLKQTAEEKINGTLTWEAMDLDPQYNLTFENISLTDIDGKDILTSQNVTVDWSAVALFDYLLDRGTILDVVRQVEVNEPSLYIREKETGDFNVQNLLKPQKEETPGQFLGIVSIHQGTIQASLQNRSEYQFTDVESECIWKNNGSVHGKLDALFAGAKVEATFTYTDERNFEGDIKTGPLSLRELKPAFDRFSDALQSFDIKDGTAELSSAKVWKSDGLLSYEVEGRLQQVAGQYDKYAITEGAAFFDMKNGILQGRDVSACINGQKIEGDVWANMQEEIPLFHGKVQCHEIDMGPLLPGKDVKGKVTAQADFMGKGTDVKVHGSIRVSGAGYESYDIPQGEALFSYEDDVISIYSLRAMVNQSHVSGEGVYRLSDGYFETKGEVENLSLPDFIPHKSVFGVITGRFYAQGLYGNGVSVKKAIFDGHGKALSYGEDGAESLSGRFYYAGNVWQAAFSGTGISYQGAYASRLTGHVEGRGDTYTVHHLSGDMGEGSVDVSGVYHPAHMNLHATGRELELSPFSRLVGLDVAGVADFDITAQGTRKAPRIEGFVDAKKGHIGKAKFDEIHGKISHQNGNLFLDSATWKKGEGVHYVTGQIQLAETPEVDIHVTTDRYRIEDLVSALGKDYPVTGYIDNKVHVTGNMENWKAEGDFMAYEGSIAKKLYQNISGTYVYDRDKLHITHGLLYAGDGVLRLDGDIDSKGLSMDVSAYGVGLDEILPHMGLYGQLAFHGNVNGAFDNPLVKGVVESRNIRYRDIEIKDVAMGLNYKDGLISINDGNFFHGEGQFDWSGSYYIPAQRLQGKMNFKNWDITDICHVFGIPLAHTSGAMDGHMLLRGTLHDPEVIFRSRLGEGYLGDEILKDGVVDVSYLHHAFAINKLYIPVGGGVLATQGGISESGKYDIKVAAHNLSLRWIPLVLDVQNTILDGNITAAIDISGEKNDPTIDFSIGVEKPAYNKYRFDSLYFMGNIEDNRVHIAQALLKKDVYKISAKGDIPYNAFRNIHIPGEAPMDFEINLDNADLNGVAIFLGPITSAEGPIQGKLHLTGDWENPEIHGAVSMKKGRATVQTLEDVLDPINLEMKFDGYRADMHGDITLGDGVATWQGKGEWENARNRKYYGDFHFHSPRIRSTYYKGALDADFTFGGLEEIPGIRGTILVHEATGDIPFALFSGESGNWPNIPLDIEVILGEKVRLYNTALYDIGLKGNMNISGSLSHPQATGRINADKGTIKLNTTEFKLDEGYALWGGQSNGLLPKVYGKATSHIGHYTISAQMEGKPGEMKTTFHSEPYLNDSQILMLLTLHANPNDADVSIEKALLNAGLTMVIGNSVQNFLKDTIGLDMISITSSLNERYDSLSSAGMDYYYVKIGKYIFPNLMLTMTGGVNNKQRSVGMHYDLHSHVGISAWYNNENEKYIGADWKFKF